MNRKRFSPLIMEIIAQNKDKMLEDEIRSAILADPLIDTDRLKISIADGVVTLYGTVDTYAEKRAAEHAIKSIKGVKDLIQKVEVWFSFNTNLAIYMGNNLVLDGKHSYTNDADHRLGRKGNNSPQLHFSGSNNEIW
jgi:hypothetical protein